MRASYTRVDVFTDRPLTGNGLAVFDEAGSLSSTQMQDLARELNLSESTFITARSPGHAAVRIFTPESELPFAGHPSLGTAAVLIGRVQASSLIVLDLKVGEVPVRVEPTERGVRAELTAPPARELPLDEKPEDLARALGLDPTALDPELRPAAWSCGNAFTFVPLRTKAEVERARCPPGTATTAVGLMAFARVGPRQVHARVFCPGSGISEDPATGSANAPLAAFLHSKGLLPTGEMLTTVQGVEMHRASKLEAWMAASAGGLLPHVRGEVVWSGAGWIELD